MAEFTPITTQEQLDGIIKDRLERAAKAERDKFADYDTIKSSLAGKTKETETLTGKVSELQKQLDELTKSKASAESDSVKTRIAYQMGLPFGLHSRLSGSTEEEIKKDAETLSKLMHIGGKPAPSYDPEIGGGNAQDAGLRAMLQDIKKGMN